MKKFLKAGTAGPSDISLHFNTLPLFSFFFVPHYLGLRSGGLESAGFISILFFFGFSYFGRVGAISVPLYILKQAFPYFMTLLR
jgi:hypothetical protein